MCIVVRLWRRGRRPTGNRRTSTAVSVHEPLKPIDDGPPPAADVGAEPSVRERAEALTARGRALLERLEGERPHHASVEVGFRWLLRDRQIAGGVLGGGLAYRLFFWVLALSVLGTAALGFAAHAGDNVDTAVKDAGLSTAVASSVSTAAQQSEAGRWWLLAVGLYLSLWFSWSLLRALRLVHAAAWQITPPPLRNAPRALGCVLATPVVLAATSAAAGWIRAHTQAVPGLLATLAVAAVFAAVSLLASRWLPADPEAPWTAFIPGAVVLGVGLEVLHAFTVYFLADKLASSSALYGALGLAGTMLFYLYLIGRGIIWAAELNAVTWEVRCERSERGREAVGLDPPATPPTGGDGRGHDRGPGHRRGAGSDGFGDDGGLRHRMSDDADASHAGCS
jgi:uncharacterized BrkB/YihY/UPF0761 family membrane protein